MPVPPPTEAALRAENDELRARLEEVEQTLHAIRSDVVDAFVIETARGPLVFVLQELDRDSSRFREVILERIHDAVVVTDESERLLYVNAAAERFFGVRMPDALAMRLLDLYECHWAQPSDAAEAASTLRATGAWRGEQVHVKRDGEAVEVEISISAMPMGEDGRAGTLRVIRDASALRASERGRALSEARLHESEQRLAIGAVEPARRLAARGGQGPRAESLVSIAAIVADAARVLRAGPCQGRRLECTLAEETPFVHGDAMQLQRVLLCFGNNAAEAMRGLAGPVVIRASSVTLGGASIPRERVLPEGRYARVEVIDTGSGIDLETQRRLFEPRFTTKPAGRSTALGLADARRLAREYGGDVRAHSVPGEGSRFELLLPAG